MIRELKTIAIVVSATLAALFVHHVIEQAQARAGEVTLPQVVQSLADDAVYGAVFQ